MGKLKSGHKAPNFAVQDQRGQKVKMADTSGWTLQAQSLRDAQADLAKSGVDVVGISPDPWKKQKKFDEKHHLNFPLLSDEDRAVAKAYGAWGEKSMYGKKIKGIIRSSFLIDEQGKIIQAWYKVSPKDTVPKAWQALEAQSR